MMCARSVGTHQLAAMVGDVRRRANMAVHQPPIGRGIDRRAERFTSPWSTAPSSVPKLVRPEHFGRTISVAARGQAIAERCPVRKP